MPKKKDYVLYVFHGRMKWVVSNSFEDQRVAWIMFDHEIKKFSEYTWKLIYKPLGKIMRFHQATCAKYKQEVKRTDFFSDVYWKKYKNQKEVTNESQQADASKVA